MKRVPIAAARRIAEAYESDAVVIFAIDFKADRFWLATYGQTVAHCKSAARLGEALMATMPNLKPPTGERDALIHGLREALRDITVAALCEDGAKRMAEIAIDGLAKFGMEEPAA